MKPETLNTFIDQNDEISSHKEYLNTIIKPSVDITITKDLPRNDESRFAGEPLVSKDFVWPVHEQGEYIFLGQINFAEIKNPPEILPKTGLLSLFYAFDEEGEIFFGDDGYVIGFFWPSIEDLKICKPSGNHLVKPKKIELTGGVDIPRDEFMRSDWPFETDVHADIRNLEGYSEDYMLGYPSYNTLAYDPTPGTEWISLLTLFSHDDFEWCWNDGDKLMVFIESDKLVNTDFSTLKTEAG